MAGHRTDEDDTRQHPVAPRYPDAAPERPQDPAPWSAGDAEADAAAQPTAQWPPPGAPSQESTHGWPQAGADQSGQPQPGWQQPAQQWQQPPQQWQQPAPWDAAPAWAPEQQHGSDYPTSGMVALAATILVVFGILATLIGGIGVAIGGMMDRIVREMRSTNAPELENIDLSALGDVLLVVFAAMLLIGILHIVSAIGIFLHRQWARIIGILLAVLGTLFGVLTIVGAANVSGGMDGAEWAVPVLIAVAYGFTLFALVAGSSHFRRRYYR